MSGHVTNTGYNFSPMVLTLSRKSNGRWSYQTFDSHADTEPRAVSGPYDYAGPCSAARAAEEWHRKTRKP